jgi:uncharacterized membrane protein
MNPDELKRTLDQISARLARLEQYLELNEGQVPRDEPGAFEPRAQPAMTQPPVQAPEREESPFPSERHEIGHRPLIDFAPYAEQRPTAPGVPGEVDPSARDESFPYAAAILSRERDEDARRAADAESSASARTRLEIQIGTRWMAWVGAIVVVLAVAFFVKLAYDQGWWGRLSPLTRCLLSGGFGALLIAAGEVALRRVGRVAAVGLFGAGIGTLYLTSYATFRYFHLLSESGAFGLLMGVALLGFGITLRGRLRTIGVLSIVGGYLSPVLLSSAASVPWALPMYLTMLLAVSLALSAALSQPFRTLRYVALVGHGVIGLAWAIDEGLTSLTIALVFMGVSWALVTAEAAYAAQRGESQVGNATASLLFTVWFVTVGCWVLSHAVPARRDSLGLFTAIISGLSATLAMNLGPGLQSLRSRPQQAVEKLAATLWAEAGVLLAVAIALQFKGYQESVGWLAMGLACVEAGRRLPSKGVSVFGLIIGALALLRVSLVDRVMPGMNTQLWSIGAISVTKWSILAVVAVIVTHAAAWRLAGLEDPAYEVLPIAISAVATIGWLWVCAVACSGLTLTGGWLLAAVLLLAAERVGRRQRHFEQAQLVLVAVICKWLIGDGILRRLDPTWNATAVLPILNSQMAMAAAIAACVLWPTRIAARRARSQSAPDVSQPSEWATVVAAMLLIWGLSFEVDRIIGRWELAHPVVGKPTWPPLQTRLLWWTLLWAVGGLAMLLLGRRRPRAPLIEAGTMLIVAAALFWLTVDTVGYRVVVGVAPARIVLNQQFAVGALLAVILTVTVRLTRATPKLGDILRSVTPHPVGIPLALIALIGLWLGSFEIDRFFGHQLQQVEGAAMARQTGLSIFWGLYGIALVAVGFMRQSRWSRYGGLALLALTLGKVLIVDMAEIRYVYRVLSLLGVGLLFVVTSIAYTKLAPVLLGEAAVKNSRAKTP